MNFLGENPIKQQRLARTPKRRIGEGKKKKKKIQFFTPACPNQLTAPRLGPGPIGFGVVVVLFWLLKLAPIRI